MTARLDSPSSVHDIRKPGVDTPGGSTPSSGSPTIMVEEQPNVMDTDEKPGYEGIDKIGGAENVPDAALLEGDGVPEDPESKARADRLTFLLNKSGVFAKLIGERMEAQRSLKAQADSRAAARKEKKVAAAEPVKPVRTSVRGGANKSRQSEAVAQPKTGSKRKRGNQAKAGEVDEADAGDGDHEHIPAENAIAGPSQPKSEPTEEDSATATAELGKSYIGQQPELITGATLRDYQLSGVQWMVSLYENGLNGILADEMGLGKTIQTISFFAHLMSKNTFGPFLVVCPLSVLANWVNEFAKFAPTIPVLMYHGTPQERAILRSTRMSNVDNLTDPSSTASPNGKKSKRSAGGGGSSGPKPNATMFPVIVTTYDMVMIDQKHLSKFMWKYIVVDEGHRLKNMDCKLIRELKTYKTANRLLLTGTPLHNNLSELWSLLNFILPDIFDDLETFQQWFDFDEVSQNPENKMFDRQNVVSKLHEILRPFLLRRLKADVEPNLPPKKEYLLYAPLTQQQSDIYKAIVSHTIRDYLIDLKSGLDTPATETEATTAASSDVEEETGGRLSRSSGRLAKRPRLNYEIDLDDDKFARDVDAGKAPKEQFAKTEVIDAGDLGRKWAIKQATSSVNNMKLQNIVMQLRKVSSHPFLFDWPRDEATGEYVVNEDLVNASGKMLLLNRLLDALFAKGHKVLLFSQFTTMLDVIEDWATQYKGLKTFRIDGNSKQADRIRQMNEFNTGGDSPDACKLFLLSTRAGGLGINLVASDTVIFFDQDWNPQMDLQAADRAHRIGQTKPVLVFRLVSANTIETKILQKAGNKRKLEALVISRGNYSGVDENGEVALHKKSKGVSTAEWARQMMDFDAEGVSIVTKDDTIISNEDLEILLDRSQQAYARAQGWKAGVSKGDKDAKSQAKMKKGEKTAFEVFVPARDDASDQLAHLFSEKAGND